MPAVDYPRMLQDVATGRLDPGRLISRTISLEEAPAPLAAMGTAGTHGMTVIRP